MIVADFDAYFEAQRRIDRLWLSSYDWTRASILNIAHMSWFSSDRTIGEYASDIWHVPVAPSPDALASKQDRAYLSCRLTAGSSHGR